MEILEKFRSAPPRGGLWKYKHPISGHTFTSPQIPALVYSVNRHEEANGYPKTAQDQIESALCVEHPFSCGDVQHPPPSERNLHVSDIVRGTRVLVHFKAAGSPLVPQEHANHRAAICVTCAFNVDFRKPCSGICKDLMDVVKAVVGGAETPYDGLLKACAICACSNAAQVHVPAVILKSGVNDAMMSQFRAVPLCWKGKEIDALG